ncbi:TonB-dependent receptor [Halieaceae bacterium IMCC14734]|uniref:TonB-dependent receptor n=1 Tax=Candidatus Litorirhabdus singularis TaxID=2518993 RepID=A0ABT3TNF6_9GAMM|nr:TonB-dependent receptor [Candidatus Litorirhabdus singularis]MCX2982832.1 TonB-dependent receptor [Candidatus Litorirhabdus singularis]
MKKRALTTAIAVATTSMGVSLVSPLVGAQEGGALEEIVVTARKQNESLQDVGLAVSAMSKTEIERTFARDIMDLASISPNMIIDDTGQGPGGVAAIFIRGIGAADVEKNFDPAVGVVKDGIFIGANAGSLLRSIDLASIEVLRGPQGTLFGRNTIGGLINVTTTQPTGELGGKVRAGLEDYDTYYVDGILNFGITDTLAAKVSLAKRDQGEGYYDNATTGEDGRGAVDYQSYGLNLLWAATDTLEFEVTYQKEETEQDTPELINTGQDRHLFCNNTGQQPGNDVDYGYCSPSLKAPISGDRYTTLNRGLRSGGGPTATRDNPVVITSAADAVAIPLEATFDTEFYSLEGRWNITDSYRVDYLFGHWESDEEAITNWDGTPELLYSTSRPGTYEQDSHEMRLTYDGGGNLSFVGGLYYWENSYVAISNSWVGFPIPGSILDIYQFTEQDTKSTAIFFEGDYAVTDALTLTLGGRYTEDEKKSRQEGNVETISGEFTSNPAEEWEEFTPRVGARYAFNDDLMAFFTYSKGYRSGGFNGRVASVEEARDPYDPETVDNYELGIKSEWLDNRLRVNANMFYMEYEDKQEELQLPDSSGTGQKTIVTNAASATIQGIEVDIQAYITDNLSLRGNLGYLDTEYDGFQYEDLGGNIVDLSDLEFRRAPDFTGTLDATYEWDMAGGNAWVRGSYHYIGEHYTNVTNSPELENDAQHLVDASVNYAMENGLQFSLFGRNLTDEDGYSHGYDVAGLWSYAATRAPRTYGVEVVYNFGQ